MDGPDSTESYFFDLACLTRGLKWLRLRRDLYAPSNPGPKWKEYRGKRAVKLHL